MRIGAALAVLLVAAQHAYAASTPTAAESQAWENATAFPVPSMFWRPVSDAPPDVVLRIGRNTIVAATPCFEYGSHFHLADDKAVFDLQNGTMYLSTKTCTPLRPAFEVFDAKLRATAGFRRVGDDIVLQTAEGNDIVTLKPVPPKGFEFREFTVTTFRDGKKLTPLKQHGNAPYLVFFGGRIQGTVGCGELAFSSYSSRGGARYDIYLNWMYDLWCSNDKASDRQADRIMRDFTGIRDVSALPMGEYELRDNKGNVQAILSPLTEGAKQ